MNVRSAPRNAKETNTRRKRALTASATKQWPQKPSVPSAPSLPQPATLLRQCMREEEEEAAEDDGGNDDDGAGAAARTG